MWNAILLIFGLIIFILLIAFKLDLANVLNIVSHKISLEFYIFLFLLCIALMLFRSIRFKALSNSLFQINISLLNSFLLTNASFFIALFTPNKAGDLLKGFFLKKHRLEVTTISLIEYFFDSLFVVLIPIFGLFIVCRFYLIEIVIGYTALAFVLVITIFLIKYRPSERFLNNFKPYYKVKDKLNLLKEYLIRSFKNNFALTTGFVMSCLFFCLYFSIFYTILHKLGAQTTILQSVISVAIGLFIGSLSFIPMGMGTRDASTYGALLSLGTDPTISMSAVLIMRSLNLFLAIFCGFCYFAAIHRFIDFEKYHNQTKV